MTSPLLKALHETAQDFVQAGLMDAQTMREFDALCLPPVRRDMTDAITAAQHTSATVDGHG